MSIIYNTVIESSQGLDIM